MTTTAEKIREFQANESSVAKLTTQMNAVLENADLRNDVIALILSLIEKHAKQYPNTRDITINIDDLVVKIPADWDLAITAFSSLQQIVQDSYGRFLCYRVEFLSKFFCPILDELENEQYGFSVNRHRDGDGCLPGKCGSYVNRFTLSW